MTGSDGRPGAIVAGGSGKGGVGKSTASLQLALAFKRRGLLDADLYGPDIPLMVNVSREERLQRWDLWRRKGVRLGPIERAGLRLMSAGFLIGEEQALTMPAPLLHAVLRQLVQDVDWGPLDLLLIREPAKGSAAFDESAEQLLAQLDHAAA